MNEKIVGNQPTELISAVPSVLFLLSLHFLWRLPPNFADVFIWARTVRTFKIRCVVMVGLPYPDKRDAELKQKMAYLDEASPGRCEALLFSHCRCCCCCCPGGL